MSCSFDQWPPLCIAHRGFSSKYPENTVPAFEAALDCDVYGIETDLQMSRDAVPVIYHNRSLKMVGGGLRRIHTQTRAELELLDFGKWKDQAFEQTAIADFQTVLDRYGQRCVWLWEIKLREGGDRKRLERLMETVIDAIVARGLGNRVMILCFDLDLLVYGHRYAPQLRYVWNQDWPARFEPKARFLYAYSLQYRAVKPELVAKIQAAGKAVLTFTVDRPADLKRVLKARVNGVMSNDPQWLQQQIDHLIGGT